MLTVVRDSFYDFNAPLEGAIPWMYLDILGYVTVGVGNLLPDEAAAATLPFYQNDDPLDAASDDSKRQGWRDVHARQDLAKRGHPPFAAVCGLRLSDSDIRSLVDGKLMQNEQTLKASFPQFEDWPADAQLALLSMSWGLGPGLAAGWPKFTAACRVKDFAAAAAECRMNEVGNPGVVRRNDANQALFRNAAAVLNPENTYDPSTLYYPTVLMSTITIVGDPDATADR
jgi:GH24 family phage-related lysozyme (muramidase)